MAQGDQFFITSAAARVELIESISVGRSQDCDLVVSEGQPSRKHAVLSLEGGVPYVEDLASTNGTYVNGARIEGKQALKDGDKVAFDANEFLFEVIVAVSDDGDQTVLRPKMEDPNRTVLRPMPPVESAPEPTPASPPPPAAETPAPAPTTPAAEPPAPPAPPPPAAEKPAPPAPPPPAAETPAPSAPEPAAAPAAPEPVVAQAAEKAKPVKPGSWADPNEKNASSTQFFSPEDLAAMRAESGAQSNVESDVPCLQITSGQASGSVIQLITDGSGKEWSIGSDSGRDIVFTDQGVSEFHSLIAYESGRWKVVDQMSTNGTFVNGAKAVAGYLNTGDVIRIGTVECTFVLPQGQGKANTAKPSKAGGSNKALVSVGVFVAVLAILFGAYFLL